MTNALTFLRLVATYHVWLSVLNTPGQELASIALTARLSLPATARALSVLIRLGHIMRGGCVINGRKRPGAASQWYPTTFAFASHLRVSGTQATSSAHWPPRDMSGHRMGKGPSAEFLAGVGDR